MRSREIIAWMQTASLAEVAEASAVGRAARADWQDGLGFSCEQYDLVAWAPSGLIRPSACVRAAAEAAIELAIVLAIWPETTADVLRPSWER